MSDFDDYGDVLKRGKPEAARDAEIYAKAKIEEIAGGPITYSTDCFSSWGSEHEEYGISAATPMEVAYSLVALARRDWPAHALEWRWPPEIELHEGQYRGYMRLSVKAKDKAA